MAGPSIACPRCEWIYCICCRSSGVGEKETAITGLVSTVIGRGRPVCPPPWNGNGNLGLTEQVHEGS